MADSKMTIWTRIETNFSAHKTLHVPCKLTWPQMKPVLTSSSMASNEYRGLEERHSKRITKLFQNLL